MRSWSFILVLTSCSSAVAQIDSLKALLPSTTHDSTRMELLREIGYQITMSYSDLEEAKSYYQQCIDLARSKGNGRLEALCTYNLAIACDVNGELNRTLRLLDSAEVMFRKQGNIEYVGNTLNARGAAYYFQGFNDKALEQYIKALDYSDKHDLLKSSSQALNNLAIIHRKSGRYADALAIYRRSIAVKRKLSDTRGIANTLNNMGVAYGHLDSVPLALAHFDSAIAIYHDLHDGFEIGSTRMAMAELHVNRGELQEARELLESALIDLADSPEDQLTYAQAQLLLGRVLRRLNDPQGALVHFRIAEKVLEGSDRLELLADLHKAMARALHATGADREAFEQLELANTLQDSITSSETRRTIQELEARYDTQEKEKQIELQSLQLEKREQERRTSFIVMGGLFVLLVGAGLFIVGRIRSNRKLMEQKQIVEQALGEKELLLREIHHRVKNNLQTVSSLLSLQSRSITDEKAREAVQDGRLRVKSMALIHQDLYREGDLTGVQMRDYVEKLTTSLIASYDMTDRVQFVSEVMELSLDVDTAVPLGLILNELITNALKYAWPDERNGELRIMLREADGSLQVEVRDDGVGYDADATRSVESTGFGLGMVKSFATKLRAEWSIRKEDGTIVTLIVRNFKLAR
ncbi:MAG: tetratricopeptide repeat protein [Flavobacteriales bacterium]|nr:tetratricopeptide repeat protein [Flavobacteriales bacterium]